MDYSIHVLRHLRLTIGRNIHTARQKQKMPLKRLALLSGVPENKLDQYELGKNRIALEDLLRIACAVEASPLELFLPSSRRPSS